jgi:hypothetical protein
MENSTNSFSKDINVLLIQDLVTDLENQLNESGSPKDSAETVDKIRTLLKSLGRENEATLPGQEEYEDDEGDDGAQEEEEKEEEEEEEVEEVIKEEEEEEASTFSAAVKLSPKISWSERVAKYAPDVEVTEGLFMREPAKVEKNAREIIQEVAADWHAVDGDSENRDPRIRQLKVQILRSLQRTLGGPRALSERGLSLKTPLIELQFEEQQKTDDDAENDAIISAKEWARIVFSAIEGGNKRFGPILELNGWSAHLSDEIERFDRPFRQLYRRYFSKRASSPGVEIAWIFFGSLVMYHMTGKLGGGRPTPSREHAGARRAASIARGSREEEFLETFEEDDMPPPPPQMKGRPAQQGQGQDISALLGGLLGGGGGQAGLSGLNLGNILSMLGKN